MAFKEIQDKEQFAGDRKNSQGLVLDWDQFSILCCPICNEELVMFDHLDMYKCRCGFKINIARIGKKNFSRGFYIGNYTDETPF